MHFGEEPRQENKSNRRIDWLVCVAVKLYVLSCTCKILPHLKHEWAT